MLFGRTDVRLTLWRQNPRRRINNTLLVVLSKRVNVPIFVPHAVYLCLCLPVEATLSDLVQKVGKLVWMCLRFVDFVFLLVQAPHDARVWLLHSFYALTALSVHLQLLVDECVPRNWALQDSGADASIDPVQSCFLGEDSRCHGVVDTFSHPDYSFVDRANDMHFCLDCGRFP